MVREIWGLEAGSGGAEVAGRGKEIEKIFREKFVYFEFNSTFALFNFEKFKIEQRKNSNNF
jgi:hypothetical protein